MTNQNLEEMTMIESPQSLTGADLAAIQGGKALPVAKAVTKAIPVLNAISSLYDGYEGYREARRSGKNVAESVGEGAAAVIAGVTYYDVWGPTPAY
ncbi:MAG: hypothetical protein ACKV2T_39425 [Kofleriaceae bacterium]